jgi:hypothetical protein
MDGSGNARFALVELFDVVCVDEVEFVVGVDEGLVSLSSSRPKKSKLSSFFDLSLIQRS